MRLEHPWALLVTQWNLHFKNLTLKFQPLSSVTTVTVRLFISYWIQDKLIDAPCHYFGMRPVLRVEWTEHDFFEHGLSLLGSKILSPALQIDVWVFNLHIFSLGLGIGPGLDNCELFPRRALLMLGFEHFKISLDFFRDAHDFLPFIDVSLEGLALLLLELLDFFLVLFAQHSK